MEGNNNNQVLLRSEAGGRMHKLLRRQIRRHFGDLTSVPPEWRDFIDAVNEAYIQYDVDREMLERSLDLSSQELLQANSEMRAVLRGFPDLIFRIDYEGNILDHKAAGTAHLLVPNETLIGRRIQSVPLKEVGRKFQEAISAVRDSKNMVSTEYSLTIGGVESSYEARLLPVVEGQILVIIRNITDRKVAEEALKESEEKFRAITNTAADAIVLMDNEGKISYWNPAAETIFGYRYSDAIGRELHFFLAPVEYHEPFRNGFRRFTTTGTGPAIGKTVEFEAIRKDGTRFPIEVSTSSMMIRGKWHAAGIIRDITERKRAEQALKSSEEEYRTLLDNINIGVYRNTGGLRGRFIRANPAIVKIFGYDSLEEFMNIRVSDLYQNPEDRRMFVEEVVMKGSVKNRELQLKRRDGTPIWASCSATVQYDEEGSAKWIDGVIEDITKRKEFEEQLRQMQKMDAIGTLAGGIAHDFNNILTAIIGYGNLLKEEIKGNDHVMTYVDQILVSSNKAAVLTQNLLAFSRRQIVNPRPVNVNGVVKKLGTLLLRVIGEDIELKTDLTAEDLIVMADSVQMEQILINLAVNARDAMPDGGTLTIRTARVELDSEFVKIHGYGRKGPYALITVEDTGQGMDERTRGWIFEPFFTTKQTGKGTGLGLSIVYGIIKQHDGFVTTYSELNKFTLFNIYLPLIKQEAVLAEFSQSSPPARGGKETILLAEDDRGVRRITRDMLERYGYTVVEAEDGQDAIHKIEESGSMIRLLIIDVIMPHKSGKEVYEATRHIIPGIKVIFMSGHTPEAILRKGIRVENVNFLPKPVLLDSLLRKVRDVLDQ